jgi:protein-disulfide isomerase
MNNHRTPLTLVALALGAALLGFAGGVAVQFTGIGQQATGRVVHAYLLEHPEVLPEAMEQLRRKDMAARLNPLHTEVQTAFPGGVLGNPEGSKVLVEFTDYACGYCRQSAADVEELIARDPELKVVIREYPILSPESASAARMALAAAEQGKFEAFHKAMFAQGRPSATTIAAAAGQAGLDMARATKFAASAKTEAEIARNMGLAEALGINGTPSWVAGRTVLSGAIGAGALAEALAGTPPS